MLEAQLVVDCFNCKMTYWARFLFNAYKQKYNNNYGGTAALGLHKYQDSSGVAPCYQPEKLKDGTQNTRQVASSVNCYTLLQKNVSRFKRTS